MKAPKDPDPDIQAMLDAWEEFKSRCRALRKKIREEMKKHTPK